MGGNTEARKELNNSNKVFKMTNLAQDDVSRKRQVAELELNLPSPLEENAHALLTISQPCKAESRANLENRIPMPYSLTLNTFRCVLFASPH